MQLPFTEAESFSSSPGAEAKQRAFRMLEQRAFSSLEHAAFHKGLLKPFKGKGELGQFACYCEQLMEGLIHLAVHEVLAQTGRYPFTLLPVRLTRQSTGAGTVFLRWTRVDRSQMGVLLWDELLADPRTPDAMIDDLYAVEQQRIALNMQISLMHTLSRQASTCADRMSEAEAAYRHRTRFNQTTSNKEA